MVKRDIQIKDEQSSRYFVIDNDILSLSALKAYYPEISGLTYMKNDKLFCVLLEGDNFHFVPDIDTYKVYSKKGQVDTPATLSQFQKEKFQSVMNCIYNQQSELPKDNEKRKKISEKKTPQSPAQNNLVQIQIIWHHRDVDKKNFYKMPGSNKYIEVYKSVNYSVAHITSLCIEAHKNEVNSNYFEKGLVKIGRKNFEVIEDFGDGGFWKFWKLACGIAHRPISLYLYTYMPNAAEAAKENSSLSSNQFPTCQSLFKTPLISAKKPSKVSEKKVECDFKEPVAKRMKSKPLEKMEDLQLDVATKVPIQDLKISETILGKGAFGEVRRGLWCESDVAVKTMDIMEEEPENIIKEVAIMSRIKHKNIVCLMGYSINNSEFHIIMDFINGFTLKDLIFKESIKAKLPINVMDKTKITYQLFLGMTFLHGFPNKILHRDLKPANIMITKKKIVKICDLGVSTIKELSSQLVTTQGRIRCVGTPMYMAPEVLMQNHEATEFSDIWSLGCTIIELFSEKHIWKIDNVTSLKKILTNQCKPDCSCVPELFSKQISACFNYDFSARPKAKDILKLFKESEIELESD